MTNDTETSFDQTTDAQKWVTCAMTNPLELQPGTTVIITDAAGQEHQTEALSGIESEGHTFPIVWIARPLANGGTDRVPWPLEAVRPA